MQKIYPTSLTPEQYAEQEHHKQVKAPGNCPNCQGAHSLEALAYYHRYITTATALVLLIWVRRFLCRLCRVSVSCLPEFAQPYRPVNTPTIAAGFNGEQARPEVQRWSQLIKGYGRRFESHLPALLRQVGNALGPVPLKPTAKGFWRQLLRQCGDLGSATRQLVHQFHTCLWGTYRCHQASAASGCMRAARAGAARRFSPTQLYYRSFGDRGRSSCAYESTIRFGCFGPGPARCGKLDR